MTDGQSSEEVARVVVNLEIIGRDAKKPSGKWRESDELVSHIAYQMFLLTSAPIGKHRFDRRE
jgi:hypothetical protein